MPAHSSAPPETTARLAAMRGHGDAMVAELAALVELESPSAERRAVRRCAEVLQRIGATVLGDAGELLEIDGCTHVRWRFGSPAVLVVGHLDTVWPLGTAEPWPFTVDAGRATGPGTYDMKAGVIQSLYAVAALADREGLELLITGDEEVGSPTSHGYMEALAPQLRAALVCEPAWEGRLKTGRKGCSFYRLDIQGRAAHGSQPERGVNALRELAAQALRLDDLQRPEMGTTVTVTTAHAGSAQNTVPAHASMTIDVRSTTLAELQRVDAELRAMQPSSGGITLELQGEVNRPPMEEAMCRDLGERALRIAAELGVAVPGLAQVPGGSDGNFTAGAGVPTLDGLGAVGDNAHAEGEWVDVAAMPERAALLAALVEEVLAA